jgi:hypothetical protein
MSIGVRCEECGKTYQVKDDMAGRRGKCPHGHPIQVPAAGTVPVEENTFAFAAEGISNPKTGRRPRPEPEAQSEGGDLSFQSPSSVIEVRTDAPSPKTSRQRRPDAKAAGKDGKPNLMPLYLGGILAVLGIGGGATMLVVSRGEVGPLREQAEAANKKAATAEERAQKAEALKLVAEADLEKLKKNPPRDPALADALNKLKAAESRAKAAESRAKDAPPTKEGGDGVMPAKAADLDPTAPGGKNDPVMPNGKLEPMKPGEKKAEMTKPPEKKGNDQMVDDKKVDAGPPKGGKSWTAPATISLTGVGLKAGDRLWLYLKDDVVIKSEGSRLTIKFRWQLRQNKDLPKDPVMALVFEESKMVTALYTPVKLTGTAGEAEAAFNIRGATGKMKIHVLISDGKGEPSAKGLVSQSTLMTLQADFAPPQ